MNRSRPTPMTPGSQAARSSRDIPPRGERIAVLLLALAGCLAAPAATLGVSIAQHQLPGPDSPAVAIQAWPGGLAITRTEGVSRQVLERVTTRPAFGVGPAQRVEALTLGTGPDGDLWLVAGQPVAGSPSPTVALEDMQPSGAPQPRYAFPAPLGSEDWPQAFAAAPDGSVWVADLTASAIERISPAGQVTVYPLARAAAPTSIAVASDGSVWFTEEAADAIGEITPDGRLVERGIPGGQSGGEGVSTEPYSLVVGPDGALWFTEQNAGRIGRMTESGQLEQFPIPDRAAVPQGNFGFPAPRNIVVGPDGALWFTDDGDESIGRITTEGQVAEYPIVTSLPASPQGITSYGGELWFAEAGVQALGSVDPEGQPLVSTGRRGAAAKRRGAVARRCPHTRRRSHAARRYTRRCSTTTGISRSVRV